MAVIKPRNRTLIFRLTQEEYQSLQSASLGARSLSDYARTKLLEPVEARPIYSELTELRSSVSRLAELIEKR
jgi:hypothetical protein